MGKFSISPFFFFSLYIMYLMMSKNTAGFCGKQIAVYVPHVPLMSDTMFSFPQLMVAQKDGLIRFFSLHNQQPIQSLSCGQSPLLSADWSRHNNLLVGAVCGSDWLVFDVSSSRLVSCYHICYLFIDSELKLFFFLVGMQAYLKILVLIEGMDLWMIHQHPAPPSLNLRMIKSALSQSPRYCQVQRY